MIFETILLTGAGFTRGFGGYLADEMWAIIFNHPEIQSRPALRSFMLNPDYDFNFELIYYLVTRGQTPLGKFVEFLNFSWPDDDKNAMRSAVADAYGKLDAIILANYYRNLDNMNLLRQFLSRFTGSFGQKDFFFTLNQDIFMERCSMIGNKNLVVAGMRQVPAVADSIRNMAFDAGADMVVVPRVTELERLIPHNPEDFNDKKFHYIKLHGSFNWLSADGSNMMVIGYQKDELIGSEPLLDRYFDIFKKVLSLPERRLMVIGYGFRDRHINRAIADAVENHGLKLYVVSPEGPRRFLDSRNKRPPMITGESVGYEDWQKIVGGLAGYYPFGLLDAFINKTYEVMSVEEHIPRKDQQSLLRSGSRRTNRQNGYKWLNVS